MVRPAHSSSRAGTPSRCNGCATAHSGSLLLISATIGRGIDTVEVRSSSLLVPTIFLSSLAIPDHIFVAPKRSISGLTVVLALFIYIYARNRNRRSVFERRQRPQHFCGVRPVENRVVLADFSVPEDQHTLGKLCNVVFVGNQDNSQTLLV
jgi:hypothetical protein